MSGTVQRLGRRGTALLLFAVIFTIYGIALAGADPSRPGLGKVADVIPMKALAICWLVTGVVGAICAVLRKTGIGFGTLMFMPLAWTASYGFTYFSWLITGAGYQLAWAGILVWGLIVGLLALIAGWPEPSVGVSREA